MIRLILDPVDESIDYQFMRLVYRCALAERRRKSRSIAPVYTDPTPTHSLALQETT